MRFFIEKDGLCIEYGDQVISSLSMALECAGLNYNKIDVESGEWTIDGDKAYSRVGKGSKFVLTAKESDFGLLLYGGFETGVDDCFERVWYLRVRGYFPRNPRSVITNDGAYDPGKGILDMTAKAITTAFVGDQEINGGDYVAYQANADEYGVVGQVTFDEYFSTVSLSENGMTTMRVHLNEHVRDNNAVSLQPGQRVLSDAWLIAFNDTDALPIYGKAIATLNDVERKFETPIGWCSWYYYLGKVSEKAILENMEVAYREKLPFKYIQIDDGWSINSGDWDANEKFPSGMKVVADKIKEKGFIPGIWVAPFKFDTTSKVYQDHPEWFVTDNVVNYDGLAFIDYSNEGAKEYLYNLFRKLSVEWGYRYIKFDLISWALALRGYKNGFNALKNYREAIKIMRSAVTEDTLLLSCTAPLSPSVKYSDATRISMDIFERWDSLKDVARQVLKRLFVNEYLLIDPDCIMLRNADKEDEECGRLCVRNEVELQTFMTLMSVTGGAVMSSDKLSLLDQTDFDKLRALAPLNTKPATALDLYEWEIPSIFSYGKRGKFDMYAFINWTEREQTFEMDIEKSTYIRGYFGKTDYGKSKKITVTLPAHGAQIVYCAEKKADFDLLTNSIMPNDTI